MLRVNQTEYEAMRAHGEETYPHECCGVMLGYSDEGVNTVVSVERAGNTRTDSAHNRYNIAPQELIRIQREARQRKLDIVGFYHSHPDHPAQWSKTDLAEAHWFGCSYVITAVEGAANGIEAVGGVRCRAMATNSFVLMGTSEEDKRLEDERIEITLSDMAESALAN